MNIRQMIEAKKEKGYSNVQISELSGVPLGTVQKIFSGETSSPRYETIQALSKAFEEDTVKEAMPAYGANIVKKKNRHDSGNKTLDDYMALPEGSRIEMINGRFYDMSGPTTMHQALAFELGRLFGNYVKSNSGKCRVFLAPTDVQIDNDDKTIVQPDILVLCNRDKLTEQRIVGAPDLIVEIISPSSIFMDLAIKYQKYKMSGVREYWIINPDDKNLLVYRFFESEEPKLYTFEEQVTVGIWDDKCIIDFRDVCEDLM